MLNHHLFCRHLVKKKQKGGGDECFRRPTCTISASEPIQTDACWWDLYSFWAARQAMLGFLFWHQSRFLSPQEPHSSPRTRRERPLSLYSIGQEQRSIDDVNGTFLTQDALPAVDAGPFPLSLGFQRRWLTFSLVSPGALIPVQTDIGREAACRRVSSPGRLPCDFFKINFYWCMVALQCVSRYCVAEWISYTYTYTLF